MIINKENVVLGNNFSSSIYPTTHHTTFMNNFKFFAFSTFLIISQLLVAQTPVSTDTLVAPKIEYTGSTRIPKYEIAAITVSGADNYEDFVLIGYSGLAVGDIIAVPGDAITNSIKRFWKQGLFSDVKIVATKIQDGKIWLNIALKERSRVSQLNFKGLKKSEISDLEPKIGIVKGNQISPNISDKAKKIINKYLGEKGFLNASIKVLQRNDNEKPGHVIVDIEVDKKLKTIVHKIFITGNDHLSKEKIRVAMKKTNDGNLLNIFRTRKFVKEEYEKDKIALIDKYNEIGYRDAYIVADSVVKFDKKSVDVYITVSEGKKYYFRNIKWVGNTIYPYEYLNSVLGIKKGDVYNHKNMMGKLVTDDNAVSKLYSDRGYLFFQVDPVEVKIDNDSIDLEMRMFEGKPATINEITIKGNTRVYEHVVRRELRTKPGQLYSQSDIMRSLRELAQMGHFNPEKITPDIQPNQEDGTVDIAYNLETKGSDQVELSAGYGGYTGIVGSVGLKFSNFAIQNIFKPETYRIVPQGEGQTLSLNARTNGAQYTSFSISFMEPWLGGKRPNSLSTSLSFTRMAGYNSNYASQNSSSYYNNPYTMGGGYGMGGLGQTSMYGGYNQSYLQSIDPDKYFQTLGFSIGNGERLTWPDDYFTFYKEFSFQRYMLKNYGNTGYFPMSDGNFNNISIGFTISRNSIDNPLYTRTGSSFSFGLKLTPPYSAFSSNKFDASNPSNILNNPQERYKWVEYHKWTFMGKTFTPLSDDSKLVLMSKVQFAYLGNYNANAQSPFEKYDMGGGGMVYYAGFGTEIVSLRGYADGTVTPYQTDKVTGKTSKAGYLYNKFTMELRYPLMLEQSANVYLLGFLEAGNAYNGITNYNPFNLKRSVGVGARVFLPMLGMIGIDWGYGFDSNYDTSGNQSNKPSGGQFHFVLGQDL
jgi:outer membrane protein insertion porin family